MSLKNTHNSKVLKDTRDYSKVKRDDKVASRRTTRHLDKNNLKKNTNPLDN